MVGKRIEFVHPKSVGLLEHNSARCGTLEYTVEGVAVPNVHEGGVTAVDTFDTYLLVLVGVAVASVGSFGKPCPEAFGISGMDAKSGSVSGEADWRTQDPLTRVRFIIRQRSDRPRTNSS